MLSWLRRSIARLDRRWIRDPGERDRHDEHVRQRLQGSTGADPAAASTDAEGPGRPGRSDGTSGSEDRLPS